MNIVLVDDNPIENHVVKNHLLKLNVDSVHCFEDANEAYDYLSKQKVDLVILDLDMPGEDGLSVVSKLHSMQFDSPISIMSGLSEDIISLVEKLAYNYGLNIVSSYLKPLDDTQLCSMLTEAKKTPVSAYKSAHELETMYSLNNIRYGLEHNQFIVHYQPQYSFESRKLTGVEALIRWLHPKDGLVFPNKFIPVLEQTHNSPLLWDALLNNVLNDISVLPESVSVSLNLSVIELSEEAFVEKLMAKLTKCNVPPSRIKLEVTETQMYNFELTTMTNIARLRILGFRLSIDDFGVGHSSLINLTSIPFTELKIDRQFVSNYLTSKKHKFALETAVELAKKLGMVIVAEGVESLEEYLAMQALGINLCQGYYTGKPTSIEHLAVKVFSSNPLHMS